VTDQVPHQDIDDVVIEREHRYTDHHYSKDWTIAPASPPRYAPEIK
jgi:hypothetical protein